MSNHFDGFVPIHSIFYSLFHPTEGTKVRFQFPPDSLENSGISFDTIKNYVIPKPQLCNKLLTFKYGSYRLVCYPVNINASYYARNSFSFDFVFVFPYDSATSPYEPAIGRLGKMFRVLEEQSQVLSKIERDPIYYHLKTQDVKAVDQNSEEPESKNNPQNCNDKIRRGHHEHAFEKYHEIMKHIAMNEKQLSIEDLITKLYEDLNNYSECLIPMDSGNAIDIKLFPLLAPPNSCFSVEDVPIAKLNLIDWVDVNWDPTMVKIVPYINGINSIAKISKYSDSDVGLVMECVKHLIYYDCVVLVDMFQFSNIYAPTSQLSEFLTDPSIARECQLYVISSEDSELHQLPFEGRPNANHSRNPTASTITFGTLKRTIYTNPRPESFSSNTEFAQKPNANTSLPSEPSITHSSKNSEFNHENNKGILNRTLPTRSCLFDLYRSLSQGQTMKDWYKMNFEVIRKNRIDVRRFITFGVFRKLIYRCYSYPVAKSIGTLDMLKRFDYASLPNNFMSPKNNNSNNVFSTADICVDFGEPSQFRKKPLVPNTDAADEVLRDAYKKLSLNERLPNPLDQITRSKKLSLENDASANVDNRKLSSSTSGTAKVLFDMKDRLSNKDFEYRDQNAASTELKRKRQQQFLLLKSIKNVDSFDKIAIKLEINKQEVEELLKATGEYNIINS
ncbi:nitrogen permease regulating protein NPR2 Ecym_3021 [Eremothecium cymbalariae DBVPG|uniref:Nitrogen permease regulator 2 n=1 Tax=Eremothecium cymbalariae (strain CBS 270.75 / DBVPG 7215 / KCTC 17166 / NRRL Y-17582) TaxID=931890 RepID=G8JQW9_ERECY|nr:Hypothetical protein Ecym_3021 [Eremothecium cymbalariae DBVPG\